MFEYRIYKEVYDEMTSGRKNIEIRLLTDKSKKIQVGDKLTFKVIDDDLFLTTKVTDKYIFNNIDELWANEDVRRRSSIRDTKEDFLKLLYEIFGEEKVKSSKLVGIEFQIVKDE